MDGPLDFDCYHLVEQILAYQSEQFYTNSINLCRNIKVGSFRNVFLLSSLSSKKRTKTSRQVVKSNFFVRILEETSA